MAGFVFFSFFSYVFGFFWNLIIGVFRRIYCWIWYRIFLHNYEKRVADHKLELFADLEEFKESFEPYPVTPVVQQTARKRNMKTSAVGLEDSDNFTILDIGVGWGANFRYFPSGSSVVAVESTFLNDRFKDYLEMIHSHSEGVKINKVILTNPENLGEVDSESVEAVVCTRVLSNVRDVDAVLAEIRRVLIPGGKFYFMEHVFTPERSFTHYMQRLLNPLQVKFGDNCHFTRETWKNIDKAGFSLVQYKRFNPHKIPFIIRPHLMGTATK